MTQKLNIVSDINRASHRANTGPPSPGLALTHSGPPQPLPQPHSSPGTLLGRTPTAGTEAGPTGTFLHWRESLGLLPRAATSRAWTTSLATVWAPKTTQQQGREPKESGSSQGPPKQRIQAVGRCKHHSGYNFQASSLRTIKAGPSKILKLYFGTFLQVLSCPHLNSYICYNLH